MDSNLTDGAAGAGWPVGGTGRERPISRATGPDLSTPEARAAVCEAAIDLCAALFNIESRALRASQRCAQPVARVRQIAMYLCNTTLGISLTEIGRVFARDRTTVSHAVQLIEDLRDDRDFDGIMDQVEKIARAAFFIGVRS